MRMTSRLEKAIRVTAVAHRNQKRKGSDIPYIIHPFSVMCLASEVTDDEDILIACLFHDIIEDVPEAYPRTRMLEEFGERVVNIVDGVTKNDTLPSWQERADAYLYHLEFNAPPESLIVSCADKIHNLMSILQDYREIGETLWQRFNAGKQKQIWWYESVLSIVSKRRPDLALNSQLDELVTELRML